MESLAQQSKESLELSQKLLVATASLNAQTVAQAKMKDAYSYKVSIRLWFSPIEETKYSLFQG